MKTEEPALKHPPTLIVCCDCVAQQLHDPHIRLAGGPASLSLGLLMNAVATPEKAAFQAGALRVHTVFLSLVKKWLEGAMRETTGRWLYPKIILMLHTDCPSPVIRHLTETEASAKLELILRLLEERLPDASFRIMTSHERKEQERDHRTPPSIIQGHPTTAQSAADAG